MSNPKKFNLVSLSDINNLNKTFNTFNEAFEAAKPFLTTKDKYPVTEADAWQWFTFEKNNQYCACVELTRKRSLEYRRSNFNTNN